MVNMSHMAMMLRTIRPKKCSLDLEIRKRAEESSFNGVQGIN